MNKIIVFVIFFLSIQTNISIKAQNGWVEQSPTLVQICAFDTDYAWITAQKKYNNNNNEHEGIYRTTNGGSSWNFVEMPGYSNLSKPVFFFTNLGYIQAENGANTYLLRSRDGGQTWENIFTNLCTFYFWSANEGWAVDNAAPFLLKRTHDRGNTWTDVGNLPSNIAVASNLPLNLKFTTFLHGWLIGTNSTNTMDYAYSTQDGGQSWTLQLARPRTNKSFKNLELLSNTEVWITRNDSFYHTTNGGASWAVTKHPNTISPYRAIDALKFQSSMVGFHTFENGLYKTTDGGINWAYMSGGIQFTLAQNAPSMLWVLGGFLKKSTNNGQSFSTQFYTNKYLKALPSTGNNFYTLSSDFLLKKTNAIQGNSNALDTMAICHNFTVKNNTLWTARLTNTGVLINTSTNGGANFSTLNTFPLNTSSPTVSISDISFADENLGMISNNQNGVYTSSNGGNSWSAHTVSGQSVINSATYIADAADTVIYVVGNAGNIHKSVNKGLTWTIQATGLSANLKKVFFLNPNQGWVVGTNGTILKTNNGGLNWSAIFSADADTNTLRDILEFMPNK